MEDIEHYDIPVYNFPYDVEEDDEDTIQDNSELRVSIDHLSSLHYLNAHTFSVFDAFCHCWLGGRS